MTTTRIVVAEAAGDVLAVRSGPRVAPSKRAVARSKQTAPTLEATVHIAVANARLSRALTRGIATALRTAAWSARSAPDFTAAASARAATPTASPASTPAAPSAAVPPRVVRLRTHRRLAAIGAHAIVGALVVVRVTERGARRLPGLIGAIRAAGALGVQIVWDGDDPAPACVAQHVFVALEDARATPGGPPVVLARSAKVSLALLLMTMTPTTVTTPTTTTQPKETS